MKTILVIEDNPFIRENIVVMLQFAHYQVIGAENGLAGLAAARQVKPDLIISDIMMPGLDGFGVLHEIRKNPDTASIPLIFLTAKSANATMLEGLERGANDYLIKPFHEQELLIAVENCLAGNSIAPSSLF